MTRNLLLLLVALLLQTSWAEAQVRSELSLTEAYRFLEMRYPALGQEGLQAQITQRELARIRGDRRPQLHWKADGRVQSENVNLTGFEGMPVPLEISRPLLTAQTYLEADYFLLDGGMAEARQAITRQQDDLAKAQTAVTAYSLRERVHQLVLQLEALRVQAPILELSIRDLDTRREQLAARVEEGVLLPSELQKLEVRIAELRGQLQALHYRQEGLRFSLEDLLGVQLADSVRFVFPELPDALALPPIQRPEQQLLAVQRQATLSQADLIEAERRPKLRVFAQAGVGYPNPLNLLDADPAPYALVGAGFSWRLLDWERAKQQREILGLKTQQLQLQEETLVFNLQQQEARYRADIQRLRDQLLQDEEIVHLQAAILEQLRAQLDEGVITSADYLQQLNAELRARQQLVVHEIELLQTQLNFWHSRGQN
jgi:outer membrane protein TolC